MSDSNNQEEEQQAAAAAPKPQLTANDLLQSTGGLLQRARVRDDGSCWVYAVLASLFVLDHAPMISTEDDDEDDEDEDHVVEVEAVEDTDDAEQQQASSESARKKRKRRRVNTRSSKKISGKKKKGDATRSIPDDGIGEPSERDRLLDTAIRSRLYERHKRRLEDPEQVLIGPEEDSMGSYGGQDHLSCLAMEFGVDIVLYDETNVRGLQSPAQEWLLLTRDGSWVYVTADQIWSRMDDPDSREVPVLHVAVSRDLKDHYEAYRYREGWLDDKLVSYEFPAWFRELEENVAVSALERREDDLYLKREHCVGTWRRAMEGDAEAMEALAKMYQSGTQGLPRRVDLSHEWQEKVADAVEVKSLEMLAQSSAGNDSSSEEEASEAMYHLGYLYEHGLKGLVQSDEEAFSRYRQSAERQNIAGMAMTACFIMNGRGGAQVDKDQGFCMMSSAAEAGSDRACLEVGMWHLHGLDDVVAKDVAEAKKYLSKAIDIGEGRQDGVLHMGKDGLQQAKSCIRSCGRAR